MARFLKTKKEEIGLSPDAILFRGEKKTDNVLLRVIDFDTENISELELKKITDALKFLKTKTTTWLNIDGLHDLTIMQEISDKFNLDTLILSDVLNPNSRPKVYEYDDCIYISIKMLQFDFNIDQVTSENLVLILKKNILLTFQERKGDVFDPLRERIRKSKRRIRSSGTDYLALAIIDIVFENYKYIISMIGEKIESLEAELLDNPQPTIIEDINNFKKEIIYLHKSIKPCREVAQDIMKLDSDLIDDRIEIHIKDILDNINHSIESLGNYNELLTNQLSVYHTIMSNKLNEIMKFLTIFSVIFIPLTFIVGVYGTNFDFLPELHFKYSYYVMWFVMVVLAVIMIFYFKRKKWF